ncbi:MAG: ECF transporter S component [Candidatus Cloacimonetes bacterium]|nr:ECF transporter S component [Candidatus Cloacimonadota bacterium]
MKKLKLSEIIFIAVVSTAMGVFWWGYTFLYDIVSPILKPLAMENLMSGVWLMGAVFFPYIIRKPGSALLGETVAAFVQGFIARWGVVSIIWGFGQSILVELFFLILGYKRWNVAVLMIAAMISAISSYLLSFFYEKWNTLSPMYNLKQVVCFIISGIIFAGISSIFIADRLKKTGILNQFDIVLDDLK